jgi:outer membrane protein OmpA-like peptidoglycan-associated protein
MNPVVKIILSVLTAIMLGGCAGKIVELEPSAIFEQYQSVGELKLILASAKQKDLDLLAPAGYQQAQETYQKAFDMARLQQPGADKLAESGLMQMQQAQKDAETSRVVLREALDARAKTVRAEAQEIYPEKFSRLDSRLMAATEAIEKGDREEAKELRAELIKDYAKLELTSLTTSTTSQAQAKVLEAEKYDADEFAPNTFKLAEEELALAKDVLVAGRTEKEKAAEHATLSVYYASKSMYITDIVTDFEQRDFTDEEKVLWYQEQLELINKPFNQKLSFDQSNFEVVSALQTKINTKMAELNDKKNALESANENIAMMEGRVESIGLKRKLEQDLNQIAEARYQTIQNMFSEEEAYVFRQGNNVLLETHAFDFQIGGSEISSDNYDLLKKIMDAINVFENPEIVIMGHTDSTGGDAINLQLSRKRAQTVTNFLKKIGKLASNKISTRGFGEARPVASNETREGRERNRRIEVLIINR